MTDAIASTLLRSSFVVFTVGGSFEVLRATAVTSWPRLVSSCRIRWPEFPVAPYSTIFIFILPFPYRSPPVTRKGNACDNTYMSVTTRIWIQKNYTEVRFRGIVPQGTLSEMPLLPQFRTMRYNFEGY